MKRKSLAWILLPVAIAVMIVAIIVVSNYQKEVGIADPGKGGRVAAAAGYDTFSKALAVAEVEARNLAVTNPAGTRLKHFLEYLLDCLRASREAWHLELEQAWDPAVQGSHRYWLTLHPSLRPSDQPQGPLSPAQVREWSAGDAGAGHWLQEALRLVD
jgi:hypothetical protein